MASKRTFEEDRHLSEEEMEECNMMLTPEHSAEEAPEIQPGEDSPGSPVSAKFTQDEEFTDPDDPVTVVGTALHIDKVTLEEEKERKQKQRRVEEEPVDEEERDLLAKYRMQEGKPVERER